MRTVLIIVPALVIVAIGAYLLRRPQAVDVARGEDNPYEGLRRRALTVSPSDLGLAGGTDDIWGVLMDLPISSATATIVAYGRPEEGGVTRIRAPDLCGLRKSPRLVPGGSLLRTAVSQGRSTG
jgi:hypothetical protein